MRKQNKAEKTLKKDSCRMIRYFSLSFVESNGKASVSNVEWKCHSDINTNKISVYLEYCLSFLQRVDLCLLHCILIKCNKNVS